MHQFFITEGHNQSERCAGVLCPFFLECAEAYQVHSKSRRVHNAMQRNRAVSVWKLDPQLDGSKPIDRYVTSVTHRYSLIRRGCVGHEKRFIPKHMGCRSTIEDDMSTGAGSRSQEYMADLAGSKILQVANRSVSRSTMYVFPFFIFLLSQTLICPMSLSLAISALIIRLRTATI